MKEHSLKTRGITGKLRRCISLLLVLSLVLPGALPVRAAENGSSEVLQETIRLEDEESVPETATPEMEEGVPETAAPEMEESVPGTATPEMEESVPGTVTLENEDMSPEAVVPGNGENAPAAEELQNPVQQMIDALPDTVTEENAEDVRTQLTAIDEAKAELSDEELEALDITKYQAAVEALLKLEGMAGANEAEVLADTITLNSNITINNSNKGNYNGKVITGSTTKNQITISGTSVSFTIRDLHLLLEHSSSDKNLMHAAIKLENNASLTLSLEGANEIRGGNMHAGIEVPAGCSVTIRGSGSLTVTGGYGAAGIGAAWGSETTPNGDGRTVGSITIEGGTVNAYGSQGAAGIGGTVSCCTGRVTISGGTVYAKGSVKTEGNMAVIGAGIGGGHAGYLESISITGGSVTAEGITKNTFYSSAIGSAGGNLVSGSANCGDISITGGSVICKGNYAIGRPRDDGGTGSVTFGDGASVRLNGGKVNPKPSGAQEYTISGEVYDTSLTGNQNAVFTVNGNPYEVTVNHDGVRPCYGTFSDKLYIAGGIKSAALTINGTTYTATPQVSGSKVSLTFGTKEDYFYGKLNATIYDTAITGERDVTLSCGDTSWSGRMAVSEDEPYCGSFTADKLILKGSDKGKSLTVTVQSNDKTWTQDVTIQEEMNVTVGEQEYFYCTVEGVVYNETITGDQNIGVNLFGRVTYPYTARLYKTAENCGEFRLEKGIFPLTSMGQMEDIYVKLESDQRYKSKSTVGTNIIVSFNTPIFPQNLQADLSKGNITFSEKYGEPRVTYTEDGGEKTWVLDRTAGCEVIQSGTGATGNRLTFNIPGGINVRIRDLNMSSAEDSPIEISGAVALEAEGNNTVSASAAGAAAIHVPEGSGLTLAGSGSLHASAGTSGGAGIGGDSGESSGAIAIASAVVTAAGGAGAAGIGGGSSGAGDVAISGGTVIAAGGTGAAGVGDGAGGSGSGTVITGGTVKASGETAVTAPKDAEGNSLSLRTVTLEGLTAKTLIDEASGLGKDVYTDDGGRLYLYVKALPEAITANGVRYVHESRESLQYLSELEVSLTGYATEKMYDGKAMPEPEAGQLTGVSGSDVTFRWYQEKELLSAPPVKAGDYTLRIYQGDHWKDFPIKISQKPLTITAKDQTVAYGDPVDSGVDQVTVGELAEGDALERITLSAAETSLGTHAGAVLAAEAQILRGTTDVSASYDITYIPGGLTVGRGTPRVEKLPDASEITYGQPLSDSTLTGGEVSCEGTFAWKEKVDLPSAGTREYEAVFTPADKSYDSVTVQVSVTVKPAPLTIGYVNMSSKAYDGTCDDLVAYLDLKGYVEGHGLRFRRDFTATAVYDDPEVGTDKWVTITVTLADTVTNYCLPENVCRVQTGIIRKRSLDETDTTITLPQERYVWDGKGELVKPVPTGVSFEMNGETFEIQPDEYTVSYENNNKFGDKAAVVVTINGKSYEGTVRKYFSIICPHDDTADGTCNICGRSADIVVRAGGGPFYYFEPVDMAAAWEKACSSYTGEAVTVEVQHTTAWASPLELSGGKKIDLRITDYRQSFDATVNVTDGELTMTSGSPADASGCVVNLSGTGKFTLNNGAVKDVSMAGGQFTMNSGRLYGDLKVGDAASQLTVNNGEIHSVILEADADVSITGGSIDSLTAAASLIKTKITGGSFGSITVPEGTGVGMLLPEGYIYCDGLGAKIEDTSVSTLSDVIVMKDSAHTISELDLREKASGYGDLETDGYHWTNESGAWALSLKDCAVTGSVIFPDNIGEITIHLEERNQVGGFFAVKGKRWSGVDYDPTYPFNFVFTGTGSLRVAGMLGGHSSSKNRLTVEKGVTVSAPGGIAVVEGTLTVRGNVSVVAAGGNAAVMAGKLLIDGGSLKVSGVRGVSLNGIYNGNERDFSDVFVMTGSGTLAADCTDYNIVVQTNRPLTAQEIKTVFRFPDGNYIPAGYSVRCASNGNYNMMSIVSAAVSDETVFAGSGIGGSLTLERQPYSVMLVQERMPYTGELVEPEVKVTDIDNEVLSADNYEIAYSNNTEIGTGTVTVTGKNGHDFSATLSFTIYCPHTSFAEADGKCAVCGETVVAQVAEGGHTANYTDLAAAWEEIQGKTTELTLLSDQEVQGTLTLSEGTDLTLQMEEGVTLSCSWSYTDTMKVEGTLRVKSGSLQSENAKAVNVQGGTLEVTGGTVGNIKVNDGTASISGGTVGYVSAGYSMVSVSGGTLDWVEADDGTTSISGGTMDRVTISYGSATSISGGTMNELNIYYTSAASISGGRIEKEIYKLGTSTPPFCSMLEDGYAYRQDGAGWVTSEPEDGNTLTGPIEILPIPVKVTGQKASPEAVEVGYIESPVLTVEAEAVGEGALTYQWYQVNAETAEGAGGETTGGESTGGEAAGGTAAGEAITGATGSTYTLPDGLAIGEYQYYCAVTCDGYTVNSGTITVAVKKRTFAVTIETDGNCRINAVLVDSEDGEDAGILVQNGDRVPEGAILKVTTTANEGYELTSSPAQSSYTVTENLTLHAAASPITYTLTVKHENGAEPEVDIGNLTAIPRDTTVTLTAGAANEGYEFIGWYQPNGKILADSAEYRVSVNTDLSVEARYQKKSGVVTFMANGRIEYSFIGVEIAESDFPAAPSAYSGFEFTGWDQTVAEINTILAVGQSVTVTAQFAPVKQTSVITVYNGEAETPETVTLEESKWYAVKAIPVEGKHFAYWTMDGAILTYGQTANVRVVSDCTLKAVYSTAVTEAEGTALLKTAAYHADTKKLVMVAYLTVPEGCRINNAGLLAVSESYNGYGPEQDLTFDNAQYIKTSAAAVGKSAPVTYTWTKSSVSIGDTWYARAYVTYEDADGQQHTVYGDRVTVTAGEDYDAAEKGTAKITSSSYDSATKKAKFVAYTTVPAGAVISKAGLVAASSSFDANNTILTAENAEYVKASTLAVGKSAPVTYTWTKSKVNSGDTWYVRAYLVYTLNGTEHTVYGALVRFTAQ